MSTGGSSKVIRPRNDCSHALGAGISIALPGTPPSSTPTTRSKRGARRFATGAGRASSRSRGPTAVQASCTPRWPLPPPMETRPPPSSASTATSRIGRRPKRHCSRARSGCVSPSKARTRDSGIGASTPATSTSARRRSSCSATSLARWSDAPAARGIRAFTPTTCPSCDGPSTSTSRAPRRRMKRSTGAAPSRADGSGSSGGARSWSGRATAHRFA